MFSMKTQAHFIFEVEDPDPRKAQYHSMMWYPGLDIMERRKREYMDTHPNIRAHSEACPSASGDSSSEGPEDGLRRLNDEIIKGLPAEERP
jgi:hypothetical protein